MLASKLYFPVILSRIFQKLHHSFFVLFKKSCAIYIFLLKIKSPCYEAKILSSLVNIPPLRSFSRCGFILVPSKFPLADCPFPQSRLLLFAYPWDFTPLICLICGFDNSKINELWIRKHNYIFEYIFWQGKNINYKITGLCI